MKLLLSEIGSAFAISQGVARSDQRSRQQNLRLGDRQRHIGFFARSRALGALSAIE
jgi:hypothetical protein